jgi:hypothetical protein
MICESCERYSSVKFLADTKQVFCDNKKCLHDMLVKMAQTRENAVNID